MPLSVLANVAKNNIWRVLKDCKSGFKQKNRNILLTILPTVYNYLHEKDCGGNDKIENGTIITVMKPQCSMLETIISNRSKEKCTRNEYQVFFCWEVAILHNKHSARSATTSDFTPFDTFYTLFAGNVQYFQLFHRLPGKRTRSTSGNNRVRKNTSPDTSPDPNPTSSDVSGEDLVWFLWCFMAPSTQEGSI